MSDLFKKISSLRLPISLKFIVGCSLTLAIALGISFYLVSKQQEGLIMKQVENEARVVFQQIVLTRKWIADHGGVFVEKLPWTRPNPYLKDAEIIDVKGKQYLKRNPAMVTKELSQYAQREGLYWFHITSLKLTNPENAPDEFEKRALMHFENSGLKELSTIQTIENSKYLRYISPLYIEKACLTCHEHQGYKIGDIRGAISITIPMDKTFAAISTNKRHMMISAVLTVLTLIGALFLMTKKLLLTPIKKLKHSIKEFSEGAYSKKHMLKSGDEFEDLCLAFSEMAEKLTDYHNCLHDKVLLATKDLEEMNAKLMLANRLLNEENIRKSDFIARASHELRTPLTSIKGAMDYISAKLVHFLRDGDKKTSLEDLYAFFEIIKKNSDRLIRMVNDMLDIEKIEAGISEMHIKETNLSELITEAIACLQIPANEKNISFHTNIPYNILAHIDEDRIRQVIINLLSNAINFSPDGSVITISTFSNDDSVITEIYDNGPGIQQSEQEKIFEKFYKSNNKGGTGIGLAICKSIIEAHKGTIGVKSPYEEGRSGSCFYFKLPTFKISKGAQPKDCSYILKD